MQYLVNQSQLKGHFMGVLALRKSKGCLQVLSQSLSLLVTLDGSQNLGINRGLICLPLLRRLVSLLLSIEDVSVLLSRLLSLHSGEIFVIDGVGDLDSGDINLGGGGQQEPLVHPSEGSSVQFEGAGDEKQPSLQLLQDHDSLPLVHTGQEDGHGAGGQGGADSPLVLGEEVDGGAGSGGILGGVVVGQLLYSHHPGAAILGSTNLLLHKHWRLGSGLLCVGLLGELVDVLLVVSGALTKPVHSGLQGVVTWLPFILVLSHTSLVEVNQAILA